MKAMIVGGTGFVGRYLVKRLSGPVVVGRSAAKIKTLFDGVEGRVWDPGRKVEASLFAGVDTVFHLAGDSIFRGRWNHAKKERIRTSRVEGTRRLVNGMAGCTEPPKTLICASAVGFCGSRGAEKLSEDASPGNDFLARICKEWEHEALEAAKIDVRVVCVRLGVVLGRDGGALAKMVPPFKLGLGGRLGSGCQYLSWIHIDDLVGIMLHAAEDETVRGVVNGVAPQAVTNSEFTRALARVLHRPAFIPVPGTVLKIVLGEFATVLLSSQRAVPEKISLAGYRFSFPEINGALQDLLGI